MGRPEQMSQPEDPDERRIFNEAAKTFGGPLHTVVACLTLWGQTAHPGGSFGKQCIIMANEVQRVIKDNEEMDKLFVATWEHDASLTTRLFKTADSAEKWRREVAEERWSRDMPKSRKRSDDDGSMADAYFSYSCQWSFSVEECVVEE